MEFPEAITWPKILMCLHVILMCLHVGRVMHNEMGHFNTCTWTHRHQSNAQIDALFKVLSTACSYPRAVLNTAHQFWAINIFFLASVNQCTIAREGLCQQYVIARSCGQRIFQGLCQLGHKMEIGPQRLVHKDGLQWCGASITLWNVFQCLLHTSAGGKRC